MGVDQAYWEWNLVTNNVFYSAQLMKLLGYPEKEFIGSNKLWEKHLDKASVQSIHLQLKLHVKEEIDRVDLTLPLVNNKKKPLWLNIVGKVVERVDNKAKLMFGVVNDFTNNNSMLKLLKSQNEKLMLAERINSSGHWHFDILTKRLNWSSEVYRIHGIENINQQVTINDAVNCIFEEDRASFTTMIDSAIKHEQGFTFKTSLIKPCGKKIKIEIIANIQRDHKGKMAAVFGAYRDITLTESIYEKLKLLAMVNLTIKVPIFFINDDDNIVYQDISPNYEGVSSVLFTYINFSITDYSGFKALAKKNGQLKENNISFDNYNTVFDLSVTYEADEGIYIWIVENVTEKFRKEQQQVISNRLALLGNTFGNVSHDINNVLGVALAATEMLELKFAKGDQDISQYIDRVKNAIDKGKDVTERLLAFTRKPTIKVVSFDPIQEIYDNQYLFKQLLLNTINISFNFDEINCLITFPQGEFINMLLNLVLNAQDAIQEKGLSGRIKISANLSSNSRLEIHIKDSGVGILPDNLTKIFDPFYSSKSVNKGNGIGLANVYSTMYKHNGLIQVEGTSDLGGAHFTLVFKCQPLESKFLPQGTPVSTLCYENTKILVLDDEVSIAEFIALFLENKGAKVTVANNKDELLEILNSKMHFDIFITDMIMPDLSGKEAVQLVKASYPNIDIYSISGYIAIEDDSWDYPVLRKPFNSKELAGFLAKQ